MMHVLMALILVGWGLFFLYTLYRFRKAKQPKADYLGAKSHASSYIEGLVAIVEIVILAAFAIPFWVAEVDARPAVLNHSFTIPEFRVKQDAVPGIVTGTTFVPTLEGSYEIACAELCGMGHYRMGGTVVVGSEEEYEGWLAEQTGWLE